MHALGKIKRPGLIFVTITIRERAVFFFSFEEKTNSIIKNEVSLRNFQNVHDTKAIREKKMEKIGGEVTPMRAQTCWQTVK